MSGRHLVYKSYDAQQAVVTWCHRAIDGWRTPHELRVLHTQLGPTTVLIAGGTPGPRTQHPVVVLPGTNFAAAALLPLAAAIARTRQVLIVDLPGQPGLSYPKRAPYVGAYGGWLDEVLGHLDPHPTVVGHSLGAAIALLASPERTGDLVLVNPAGFAKVRLTPKLLGATVPWLLRPSAHTARDLAQHMAAPTTTVHDDTVRWLELVGRNCRATTAPSPVGADVLARWRGRDVRLLLGDADPFFPRERIEPVAVANGFAATVVTGAGHLVPEERPDAVLAALR
jgi:pimeloyl-ACP methyl ester carboxylesterase